MTLRETLHALLTLRVGAETLIFTDQNAPRPALPYWTISVSSQRAVGTDDYGRGPQSNGSWTVRGVRESTVQLQRFGEESEAEVARVRDELRKPSVQDAWAIAKLSVFDFGNVQNLPVPRDGAEFEPRAVIDLMVRYGSTIIDTVNIIETVNTGVTVSGSDQIDQVVVNL